MFDIGFTEILLIAVIGLLVIGPKRLPEVARTLGRWTAKLRNFIAATRADLEREFNSTEFRQLLDDKQGEIDELRQMIKDTRATIEGGVREIEADVNQLEDKVSSSETETETETETEAETNRDVDRKPETNPGPTRILTEVQKNALTAKKPPHDDPDT